MADEQAAHAKRGRAAGLQAARDAYYRGDIAATIVKYHRENGDLVTAEDLAGLKVRFEPPVRTRFGDIDLFARGPWCQGPVAALCGVLLAAPGLGAQPPATDTYPTRPIRIVVPFPPGAGTDIIARAIGQVLNEAWRQPVIVDNRTGAGGTIGSDIVAKASADGYTLLLGNVSTLALAPSLHPKLPYVPLRDFAPITLITTSHNVLVVHPSVAATSVKELIALARAKPKQLAYGSSGSGTTSHLGGALFAHMAGVELLHVPYKGSAPAHVDLLAGQLHLSFSTIVTTLNFIKSGRLKALGVTSLKRSPLLPNLPSISEAGLPGFEVLVWQGIVAPGATPRPIVAKLNQEIAKNLRAQHMNEQFARQGLQAVGNSPEEFAAFIRSETEKWGKVIRLTGAKAE